MCGIAGILNFSGALSPEMMRATAQRMANTMTHRGPDDGGIWIDPTNFCALAHRRLSIIDTSPAGRQPMLTANGDACISYNGELYNFEDLRNELQEEGCSFRGRTDTEVFLQGLRTRDVGFLEKTDAMFALAYFDVRNRELILARDAFGEKPLYYTFQNGIFAFASELHALMELPNFDASIGMEAIASYLCFQYVPAPATIYSACRKLEPGSFLRISQTGPEKPQRYFSFTTSEKSAADRSIDEAADELEDILVRLLKRRLISDVPLGAFLSGGVDSSLVAALITKRLNRSLKTFTVGFRDTQDTEHLAARDIARHLQTDHYEQILGADRLELGERIGTILDEPNGDSSCLPTFLLAEFARRAVTVCLSGDGGDEMFGGYGRYFACIELSAQKQKEIAAKKWHKGREYISSRLLIFADRDLEALLDSIPTQLERELVELRTGIDNASIPLINVFRELDARHYMPGSVLAKVDRMSMQNSLEVRTPYLSPELAHFAGTLPADLLYANGQGKQVLKRLASRYFPAEWIDRPKMGFGLPIKDWGHAELRVATLRLLEESDARLPEWIGRERIRAYAAMKGDELPTYQLWSLLVLENWLRVHPCKVADHQVAAGLVAAVG